MRRHKVKTSWHRLYKDATSRVSDEPPVRIKSLSGLREHFLEREYPYRTNQRSWKSQRRKQYKSSPC